MYKEAFSQLELGGFWKFAINPVVYLTGISRNHIFRDVVFLCTQEVEKMILKKFLIPLPL